MELTLNHLCFSYGERPVLQDVCARAEAGRLTAIAGPNGVGKSTLLKCIARLLKPSGGAILFDGNDITGYKSRELARLQAYVPQNASLSFPLTAGEYVSLGRRPYVDWALKPRDEAVIRENVRYMGIERHLDQLLDELSGGERQKVLLTCALVQEPRILLLDEPTSALDIRHQLEVMLLLRRIARDRNCVVVIVLHDLTLIERFADRVILMKEGRVFAQGDTEKALDAASIREVYGIEAELLPTRHGRVVVPVLEEDSCITE